MRLLLWVNHVILGPSTEVRFSPPSLTYIAASHRLASYQSDPRRGKAAANVAKLPELLAAARTGTAAKGETMLSYEWDARGVTIE